MTDYASIAEKLKSVLNLKGSPVAIKLAKSAEEIPAGVPEIEEAVRHCRMIALAREGKIFYALDAKHQCGGGAWALGLRPIGETLKTGQHYFKLGKYSTLNSSRRTMAGIPHMPQETYATLYAPLESAPFVPDVVVFFAQPAAVLKLAQSTLFNLGGRIYPEFSGIQSLCSDVTSYVLLTGKPNFSLGCDGSRKFSGIGADEMVAGFPAEMMEELAENIDKVAKAPGSAPVAK